MFKDIKRGASRAKEKLHRSFGGRKHNASATNSVAGGSEAHDTPSRPGPSPIDGSAAHMPPVAVSLQPGPRSVTPHPDTSAIFPAPMSMDTHPALPNPEFSHENISISQLPEATTSSAPATDVTQHSSQATAAFTTPQAKQSVKHHAWAGLKTLLGVLNESADAFAPLKSAVGSLVRCIEIYENQASAREGYEKLRTELDGLCQDISGYIRGAATPSMTPCIANLARGIEVETELVLQKRKRNAVERHAEAMEDANEILECYHRIQMHLGRLALNTNLKMWKIVDEQAVRNRLKELPYSPAAKYCSKDSVNFGRNGCTPNTREDILEQLQVWAQDRQSQKIYWLNGMAGTGKTSIAYSLCEQIERVGKLAASFFCYRQLSECRDAGRIVPSIAYQLSLFSGPFQCAISKVLEKDPDVHNQPPDRQFESLIAMPLREVKDSLPNDLVIVVDALDECDSSDSVERMLSALLTHAPDLPVKVFVTSRPNPQILDQMRSEQAERARSELHLHELDHSIVQSDIKTYLTAELGKLGLNTADLNKLVQRSGVLFVYAATVVRYLKHDNFARATQRLKQVLSTTATATGNHREVDALYTGILQAALDDEALDGSEREEMTGVLRTVVCAQEPLSVNDIAGLLGLDDVESVHAALRPLLSVLRISDSSELVTTLHESFPDYLFDEKRSKLFYCDAQRHHAWFARTCFALLNTPDPPFNICNLESSYLLDREVPDLDDRVRSNISQHLFYACRYWEAHMEAAELPGKLLNELFGFLSTRLLLWIEIMNLKQEIQRAGGVISKLHMWLQHIQCSSEIRELTRDAWHFVTEFASGEAKQLTPHIYVSALAIWPEHSPISRHYRIISGLTKVTGTAMDKRESTLIAPLKASGRVLNIADSPDGARLVSGSSDDTIQIWDAHTGQMIGQPLRGHTGSVNSVGYSRDGVHVVSGSVDKTIRIWDAHTGQMIGQPLQGDTDSVLSVAYSPDGARIVSGSLDKTIRIWDAHTGQIIGQPLRGHTSPVNSITYSPDGARIVSGSSDKTIRIWDAYTGQMVGQPLHGHTSPVNSIAYSHDGSHIVSGSHDWTIRIWDPHTGKMIGQPLHGHTNSVLSVAYSHDGARIVSGSGDSTIRIWDARSGQMIGQPLQGHVGWVNSVAYSRDGARIVSGSADSIIGIWDAHAGQMIEQPLQGHVDSVHSVAYSPDGARIVSGSHDKTIRIWDAHTGRTIGQPLQGHTDSVNFVACSPDGARIASGSSDEPIRVLSAHRGQMIGQPLEGHNHRVDSITHWTLSEAGWVVTPLLQRLIWIPSHLRVALLRPSNTLIISTRGSVKLDFSNARFGEEWRQCYHP